MNILTDALPVSVEIDGTEYPVNSDFRSCLRIIMACEDNDLAPQEKQIIMLANLYPKLPENTTEALQKAAWFLDCGKEGEENDQPRVYSFSKDSDGIFAAFKQIHGIDLDSVEMHWWKFVALFMAVVANQDCPFGSLVSLRLRLKTGKATKEEREAARNMGDVINIEEVDTRSLEEKDADEEFMRLVNQGKK